MAEEAKVGIGQKIVTGIIMLAVSLVFFIGFVNWILMVPAQNLPYPYK